MEEQFYLYSLTMGAWVGRPTYTSDLDQAKTFSREEAFKRAQQSRLIDGPHKGLILLPIPTSLIEELLA